MEYSSVRGYATAGVGPDFLLIHDRFDGACWLWRFSFGRRFIEASEPVLSGEGTSHLSELGATATSGCSADRDGAMVFGAVMRAARARQKGVAPGARSGLLRAA